MKQAIGSERKHECLFSSSPSPYPSSCFQTFKTSGMEMFGGNYKNIFSSFCINIAVNCDVIRVTW